MSRLGARAFGPRCWRTLTGLGTLVLTLVGVGVPVSVYLGTEQHSHLGRQIAVTARTTSSDLDSWVSFANNSEHILIVVGWSDIYGGSVSGRSGAKSSSAVTAAQFGSQLQMLQAAGFESITAGQYLAYVTKRAKIPVHSMLLTFDGDRSGYWTYADPLLKKYHDVGLLFVAPSDIGSGRGLLTWGDIGAMASSGRWSIEGASGHAHADIVTSKSGAKGPWLLDQGWLADKDRLETVAGYRERVSSDLGAPLADLPKHGVAKPLFFSYGFAAGTRFTGGALMDPDLASIVNSLYVCGFVNSAGARPTDPTDCVAGAVPRYATYSNTTAELLFTRISASIPGMSSGPQWLPAATQSAGAGQ